LIESNDIISRKKEIKGFVATAKLDLAVKRCIDFYQDFGIDDDDEAVLLSMRFHEVIKNEKMGMWTEDVVTSRKTQIAMTILTMIKDFSNLQLAA
jgi:Effector-associated domain 11